MKLWSPLLHPLLSRAPDRARTLSTVLLAPLALVGLAFCGHLMLFPLWLAIRFWPTGPARWLVLLATLGAFSLFAYRSIQEIMNLWREARAIAIDQIMFAIGCIIWSLAAVILTIYA